MSARRIIAPRRTPLLVLGSALLAAGTAAVRVSQRVGAQAAPVHARDDGQPRRSSMLDQMPVFEAGKDGYHTYRIPALIVSKSGALLALCEGRKHSQSDAGDIDTVLRRSLDNGATWEPMQVVADDGANTFGNPCPVVDRDTGTISLLLTHNLGEDNEGQIKDRTGEGTRTVWVTKSTDEGVTWSGAVEITDTTKAADWTWYATGPGVGIQLRSGRLLIPCDHAVAVTRAYRAHVIYSDDHGATWRIGGVLGEKVNECQAVELHDGTLLINMRSYHGQNRRAIATSGDGGLTWSDVTLDQALIEPVCQASFIRFTLEGPDARPAPVADSIRPTQDRNRLLFSNPASTKREMMTVRISYDEGKTWPVSKVLYGRPSAYSCLTVLPDMSIGCLYERGEKHPPAGRSALRRAGPYETITFARFSLEWLTDGADRLGVPRGGSPVP